MKAHNILHDERIRQIIRQMAECNLCANAVAKKLYMNRNTVIYQMNKIQQQTGLDPRNFYDLIRLLDIMENTRKEAV